MLGGSFGAAIPEGFVVSVGGVHVEGDDEAVAGLGVEAGEKMVSGATQGRRRRGGLFRRGRW